MKDCLICKWMKEKKSVVCYIGNNVVIIPNLSYAKYHVLICPKKHYESIFDMLETEYDELFGTMKFFGQLIEDRLDANATRYMLNNNYFRVSKSKFHIKHVHAQIFPCFETFTDISGKYRKKLSDKEIKEMKKEIIGALKHVQNKANGMVVFPM